MHALICPECGRPMELAEHPEYTYPAGGKRLYYRCTDRLFCIATHWAHPDGTPLGVPGDRTTKEARIAAHEALDHLRTRHCWSRRRLYGWLQGVMNLSKAEAHVGRLTAAQCEAVIGSVEEALGIVPRAFQRDRQEDPGGEGGQRLGSRTTAPAVWLIA
jgi:hypothetical protein